MIRATLESSVFPPFVVVDTETIEPQPKESGLMKFVLSFVRPKATVDTDLPYIGTKVWQKYGEPFPWQIGFVLMMLGIAYIGHLTWSVIRRLVK
jgi:hypothetical protein